MTDRAEALLAELVDVQRRTVAIQESIVANQREMMDRQRQVARRLLPAIALMMLVAIGPYLWRLIASLTAR
jgi:hypothetical protein